MDHVGLKGELGEEMGSATPSSSTNIFQASQFPSLQSTATQSMPQQHPPAPAPNSLAVLGQLLAAIGTISASLPQQPQQAPGTQLPYATAFKPASSDCQLLAPVSQYVFLSGVVHFGFCYEQSRAVSVKLALKVTCDPQHIHSVPP
jgi:hypothetical protein